MEKKESLSPSSPFIAGSPAVQWQIYKLLSDENQ